MLRLTLTVSLALFLQTSRAEIDHGIDFDFSQDDEYDDLIPSTSP